MYIHYVKFSTKSQEKNDSFHKKVLLPDNLKLMSKVTNIESTISCMDIVCRGCFTLPVYKDLVLVSPLVEFNFLYYTSIRSVRVATIYNHVSDLEWITHLPPS